MTNKSGTAGFVLLETEVRLKRSFSLLFHIILLFTLIIGFYLLVAAFLIGILSAFFYTLSLLSEHHVAAWIYLLVILGWLGIIAIIVPTLIDSLFPLKIKFLPPGPALKLDEHHELFKLLSEQAYKMKQKMPSEIYIDFEHNIGVSESGGLLGIGSRRFIRFGLPLLASLNLSEFRSVIAHEFGHYFGGFIRFLQIITNIRLSLEITVESLQADSNFLHFPFLWYGKLFLRITQAISRAQEYIVDDVSARMEGTSIVISTLKKIQASYLAFSAFWAGEIIPILNQGLRPPIIEGYKRFILSSQVRKGISLQPQEDKEKRPEDSYDSHPDMQSRINALLKTKYVASDEDNKPAIGLLKYNDDIELQALYTIPGLSENIINNLNPVSWDEVESNIWPKVWREYVQRKKDIYKDITPKMFPGLVSKSEAFFNKISSSENAKLQTLEEKSAFVQWILTIGLNVILLNSGWQPTVRIGEETVIHRNNIEIVPNLVIEQLASGTVSIEEWQNMCTDYGIADTKVWSNESSVDR